MPAPHLASHRAEVGPLSITCFVAAIANDGGVIEIQRNYVRYTNAHLSCRVDGSDARLRSSHSVRCSGEPRAAVRPCLRAGRPRPPAAGGASAAGVAAVLVLARPRAGFVAVVAARRPGRSATADRARCRRRRRRGLIPVIGRHLARNDGRRLTDDVGGGPIGQAGVAGLVLLPRPGTGVLGLRRHEGRVGFVEAGLDPLQHPRPGRRSGPDGLDPLVHAL